MAIERTEVLSPWPAEAFGELLGVPVPDLGSGEGLPPLWHWIYLLEHPAQSDLGADGHSVRGTLPEPSGPGRRMWAGGRVRTAGALRCGEPATKTSSGMSVNEKHGRSGQLTFVTVGHQLAQGGVVVVDEEQDIVYRDAAAPGQAPVAAPVAATVRAAADPPRTPGPSSRPGTANGRSRSLPRCCSASRR
jgi:3-methylfumaryl-CoA hydratase